MSHNSPNAVKKVAPVSAILSTAPASNTRRRAAETAPKRNQTSEDITTLKEDRDQRINSPEKAADFLRDKGWISADTHPNFNTLIYLLLYLASSAKSQVVTDGIRSLAFYAEAIRADGIAGRIVENVELKLKPVIDQLNGVIDGLQGLEKSGKTMLQDADETICALKDERDRLGSELQKAVEEITVAGSIRPPNESMATTAATAPTRTYAAALQAAVPQSHETILARQDIRSRQVLVDGLNRREDSSSDLNEEGLLQKARLALEAVNEDPTTTAPVGSDFVAVKRLQNGGVLYELTSVQAAQWLRRPNIMKAFASALGGSSVVKAQTFPILAEFVPITFKVDNRFGWSEVETRSNLNIDDIKDGRWIKPEQKRYEGQRFAHLIVNLTSPEAANAAIRKGLIIAGKRVHARKLITDPRRCLKCQRFDPPHLAKDCKQIHDTCGTCGSLRHVTADCTEADERKFHCVNCKVDGHASWSRDCPMFIARRDRLMARRPECQYVFYPTSDPLTWEQSWDHAERSRLEHIERESRYQNRRDAAQSHQPPETEPRSKWADQVDDEHPWPSAEDHYPSWPTRSQPRLRQATLDHFRPSHTAKEHDAHSVQSDRFPRDDDYA